MIQGEAGLCKKAPMYPPDGLGLVSAACKFAHANPHASTTTTQAQHSDLANKHASTAQHTHAYAQMQRSPAHVMKHSKSH